MLLETMMTMACPSYGALIASWIMLIGLGNSSGGLIMFGGLYLMRRRVMKRRRRRRRRRRKRRKRRKNLVTKKSIWIVLSRMMNM
jgi:U3 small nucleolar ribonucleoprotein component